jgi:hypothetical protein
VQAREEKEAWRAFKEPIQRVIGCVDQTARLHEKAFPDGVRLLATTVDGIPFGDGLVFRFSLQLEPILVDDVWRMSTRRYDFTIWTKTKVPTMVFGWHWHPASKQSKVAYPHLHVPSALSHKSKHIPTGRISLEDVVLFGFDELGVTSAIENAVEIVNEARDLHKRQRSWS